MDPDAGDIPDPEAGGISDPEAGGVPDPDPGVVAGGLVYVTMAWLSTTAMRVVMFTSPPVNLQVCAPTECAAATTLSCRSTCRSGQGPTPIIITETVAHE